MTRSRNNDLLIPPSHLGMLVVAVVVVVIMVVVAVDVVVNWTNRCIQYCAAASGHSVELSRIRECQMLSDCHWTRPLTCRYWQETASCQRTMDTYDTSLTALPQWMHHTQLSLSLWLGQHS